ncbi:MAG: carboxylating nicotinate-nucleotide diphosphorylase [Nitrospirales bacterium]|nr:carboxylating nicotinate-nucleotide diphosphorylase [Nitrospirales bacterium]
MFRETIRRALQEDIGQGDITSFLIIPEEREAGARLIAKEDFILAGMPFVEEVFRAIDPEVRVTVHMPEGFALRRGDIIAEIAGRARSLLAGERVSLNILQRISGIATLTHSFVGQVEGLPVRIADTRKTVPGMRLMEKYGVRTGGGTNHRFGLFDGILIKDNHIEVAGGVKEAVLRARKGHHLLKVEVEVKDMDEVRDALDAGADIIMLDNMSLIVMAEAVRFVQGRALLEASGNVSLTTVRSIAETGVDIISVGALTHSARAADISMKIRHGS